MKSNSKRMAAMVAVVVVGLALVVGLFGGGARRAEAAAAAAPTPVTIYAGSGAPQVANFMRETQIVTSVVRYSPAQNLQNSEKVDLQWVVVPRSTPNALSIQLQFSNDGVNWIGGPYAIATPNATPQNEMQQFAVFGRYGRIAVDAATADRVDVTVIGLGK